MGSLFRDETGQPAIVSSISGAHVRVGGADALTGTQFVGCGHGSASSGAVQAVSTGGTIAITGGTVLLSSAAAASGMIMPVGNFDGQEVTLINTNAANLIDFAAAGTSRVANGASCDVFALTAVKLVWSASQALWYQVRHA